MKKILMMIFMMFAVVVNAETIELVKFKGGYYTPTSSKIRVSSQEEKDIIQKTIDLMELDYKINQTYKQKTDYIPFDYLHKTYGKVMKGSDDLAIYFLSGHYTPKTLELYKKFEINFIQNLEDNIKMAKERGLPKDDVVIVEKMLQENKRKSKRWEDFIKKSLELDKKIIYKK